MGKRSVAYRRRFVLLSAQTIKRRFYPDGDFLGMPFQDVDRLSVPLIPGLVCRRMQNIAIDDAEDPIDSGRIIDYEPSRVNIAAVAKDVTKLEQRAVFGVPGGRFGAELISVLTKYVEVPCE